MGNFPKYVEKSPIYFCIFTIYHPLFCGIQKAPFGDAKRKNAHIYPILLEQREKTCVKFLETGSKEHFAQKLCRKFYMLFFCISEN